jgi:hypothetical protein
MAVSVEPIRRFVITGHTALEMARRHIDEVAVRSVLAAHQQRLPVRPGRDVLQSRVQVGKTPKEYLLRVFVDVDRSPAEVVTVYRTSKVTKYWQEEL